MQFRVSGFFEERAIRGNPKKGVKNARGGDIGGFMETDLDGDFVGSGFFLEALDEC